MKALAKQTSYSDCKKEIEAVLTKNYMSSEEEGENCEMIVRPLFNATKVIFMASVN